MRHPVLHYTAQGNSPIKHVDMTTNGLTFADVARFMDAVAIQEIMQGDGSKDIGGLARFLGKAK